MQNQAWGLLTCDSKLLLEREDNEEWLTSDAEKFWKKALSTSGVHLQDPLKFIKTYSRIWEYVSNCHIGSLFGWNVMADRTRYFDICPILGL